MSIVTKYLLADEEEKKRQREGYMDVLRNTHTAGMLSGGKDILSGGWDKAKEFITDKKIQFILLDEINIALRYKYLDIDEVVDFLLSSKPFMTHVVLTGRNADPKLIEISDLVTEMNLIKHPFKNGIKAQRGIEF